MEITDTNKNMYFALARRSPGRSLYYVGVYGEDYFAVKRAAEKNLLGNYYISEWAVRSDIPAALKRDVDSIEVHIGHWFTESRSRATLLR